MESSTRFLVVLGLVLAVVYATVAVERISERKYSPLEKSALEKFKPVVKDVLYRDYMKEDWYLIVFLRAQKFNIQDADQMLRRAHKWRRDNKIDTILTEDMAQLQNTFPYFADGIDREGRPIITWAFGKWDVRKISLAGRMDLLERYTDRMLEEGFVEIRKQRNATGLDITQNVIIIDGNGYNIRTHACVTCLPFYYNFITHSDSYYPELTVNIHLINVPRIFESLMSIIRPIMSERTRNALRTYGHDKTDWQKEFSKSIPLDQIRPIFGGSKKDDRKRSSRRS